MSTAVQGEGYDRAALLRDLLAMVREQEWEDQPDPSCINRYGTRAVHIWLQVTGEGAT
jgi:hypothetical protein